MSAVNRGNLLIGADRNVSVPTAETDLVDLRSGCADDERALVLLKYREDMRNVDIAREMNMNPSTVSTVLARAIGKMRACVERS